ncbi:PHP domain-containing protein [Lachnospiraceae bacterium NSJ-143]|nr:PHP domain-containing protein [Lachnospiraceae bacterium NSJ-143]
MQKHKSIDLHTHSTFSDGTYTPEEIVREAVSKNLSAVALTDHDCVYGLEQFQSAGKKYGIETINGIELASYYSAPFIEGKVEIHIVGLFIDRQNKELLKRTEEILAQRVERNKKMVKRLTELGFPMTYNELRSIAGRDSCSRTHYALLMVQKGYVKDKKEAFSKYISTGMPGFVPRVLPTPDECICLIKNAGGVPVLAHPTLYRLSYDKTELMAADLRKKGMEAAEVMYSTYSPEQEAQMTAIAESTGLARSGGSDFHGTNKTGIFLGTGKGNLSIPEEFLYELKSRCRD